MVEGDETYKCSQIYIVLFLSSMHTQAHSVEWKNIDETKNWLFHKGRI